MQTQGISVNTASSEMERHSNTLRSINHDIDGLKVGSELHRYQIQRANDRHVGILSDINWQPRRQLEYAQHTLKVVKSLETRISPGTNLTSDTIVPGPQYIAPSITEKPQPVHSDIKGRDTTATDSDKLSGCFYRLAQLAQNNTVNANCKDDQSGIDELETIVDIVCKNVEQQNKRKRACNDPLGVDIQNFKKIKRSLMLSTSVTFKLSKVSHPYTMCY
jgi:hypothetical protein